MMNTSTDQSLNIQVDNVHVCYEDYGNNEPVVIFIHGFPFDKSSWQPQMDFLKTFNRVIAYDIRGFCRSTTEDMKASIDLFAADLIGLMDALEIKQAVICGLSMGGYIALNAIKHYPERFRGLILCDTQSIADTDEGKEKRYKTIEQIENNGLTEFADAYMKNVFAESTLEQKKDTVEHIRSIVLNTPVSTIARTMSAIAQRIETSSSLENINVPTLILCGNEDKLTPPEQSWYMHEHIKNSELHIIPGAAHLSNLEQPDVFNQHMRKFLDKLEKQD
jgi:3-oxoadipate enol-lactonase